MSQSEVKTYRRSLALYTGLSVCHRVSQGTSDEEHACCPYGCAKSKSKVPILTDRQKEYFRQGQVWLGQDAIPKRLTMQERDLGLFNDSLERCQRQPGFLNRFCQIFIASDAEVAEKFAETDMKRQEIALKVSLFTLLEVAGRNPTKESLKHLEEIAERHDRRHHDIKPEMYSIWVDCMLQTVREFDDQYAPDVDRAWREALATGIRIMTSKY